ncbi:hypothetical protein ASJ81_12030 [Methanosarcina spelaei]|jgi:hypothetical protein|uniref:Uncharacterized protein n=1 Tax=Methanosarcina spelaei TaxID=1036679 RepID=A0A2A2HNB8_9EURY|nr:hypothetical protein [Methanosarcina spelaei]PAV10848.1 hypothetical protein ASJ81_12030 [Methanosarcina spelaei]
MKIKRKLRSGILLIMLLLVNAGTVMAAGGSSYSGASTITVPEGEYDYFGEYTKGSSTGDWFKFAAEGGEDVYIDLRYIFYRDNQGEMLQYKTSSTIKAHVCNSPYYNDHWGEASSNAWPRIEMRGDTGAEYDFIVGRYD